MSKNQSQSQEQEQSKQLQARANNEVAEHVGGDLSDWGHEELSSSDIILPKLLPMQLMSEKVVEGKAQFGEIRDNVDNKLMGSLEKPLEVIPFARDRVFIEFETAPNSNDKVFKRVVPIVVDRTNPNYNDDAPYEQTLEDGTKVSRDRTLNFYVLIPDEIKEGSAIPYVLPFRRTSMRGGRKLETQMFMKNRMAGKVPCAYTINIVPEKQKNDKGTFIVLDISTGRAATGDEIETAFYWNKMIKSGQTKVNDSDLVDEGQPMSADIKETGDF